VDPLLASVVRRRYCWRPFSRSVSDTVDPCSSSSNWFEISKYLSYQCLQYPDAKRRGREFRGFTPNECVGPAGRYGSCVGGR